MHGSSELSGSGRAGLVRCLWLVQEHQQLLQQQGRDRLAGVGEVQPVLVAVLWQGLCLGSFVGPATAAVGCRRHMQRQEGPQLDAHRTLHRTQRASERLIGM